jgi:membrane associated rhomboid family serine protease
MTGEPFPDRFRRWYGLLPPALRVLMTANAVLYVVWLLISLLRIGVVAQFTLIYLALNPVLPEVLFRPWQLLTYAFLHVQPGLWGFISFGFNMLWLYWLGRDYEEIYGSHRLFSLYVLSTVGGGLLALLAATFMPPAGIPVAGAMAAVLGVICGVATINPDRGIGLLFLGVIKLKWIAVAFVAISVLFAINAWPYVAVYLGGAGTGYLFARAQLAGTDLGAWSRGIFDRDRSRRADRRAAPREGGTLGRLEGWLAGRSETDEPATLPARPARGERRAARKRDAVVAEAETVDRLLDKISEQGYDSLTDEEKRILYEASRDS